MIVVIGITGYTGRMGQAVAKLLESHAGACLAGGVARYHNKADNNPDSPLIVTDDPNELFPHCDVIVDFSHPTATPLYARLAARAGKPFVCGTTGLEAPEQQVLMECAQTIPLLYAPNTSLSLAVARHAAASIASLLKEHDYDISIVDKHHRWKKDMPSGTALSLSEAIMAGNEGRKQPDIASIRSGAIIGEHEIMFAGAGETITLHHQISDRRVFARGAVHAALWLASQKPGFYTMDDVLGLNR